MIFENISNPTSERIICERPINIDHDRFHRRKHPRYTMKRALMNKNKDNGKIQIDIYVQINTYFNLF